MSTSVDSAGSRSDAAEQVIRISSIGCSVNSIFTTETYRGQRVQKFIYKGMGPVTKKDQGVLWPKKSS
jgi:hypothetical protein